MSDYGFATYDPKGKNRLKGVVNSKWPIFGPKYSDIQRAFKTVHITDTYQQDFVVGPNVRVPDPPGGPQSYGYSESRERGSIRKLVATIPHGYGFRPLGYVQFNGVIVQNTRSKWKYDNIIDYYGHFIPSLDPLYGVGSKETGYTSIPGMIYTIKDISLTPGHGPFSVNYPENVYYYLKNPYGLFVVGYGEPFVPYEIEIDEENVYVYRNTYWLDQIGRYYSWSDYYSRVVDDCRARSQGVIDWAGTELDLTIYLCPYKLSDLIMKEYVDTNPSNVAIFDQDVYDGGKVFD